MILQYPTTMTDDDLTLTLTDVNENEASDNQLLLLSNENQQLRDEIQRLRNELETRPCHELEPPPPPVEVVVGGALAPPAPPASNTSASASFSSASAAAAAVDHNADADAAPMSDTTSSRATNTPLSVSTATTTTTGTPPLYPGPELIGDNEIPHPRKPLSFMEWATINIDDIESINDYQKKLAAFEQGIFDIVGGTKSPAPAGWHKLRSATIAHLPDLQGNTAEETTCATDGNTLQTEDDQIDDPASEQSGIPEAVLVGSNVVDEEVIIATPFEPTLPWWQQRHFVVTASLLVIVFISAVAVIFSDRNSTNSTATEDAADVSQQNSPGRQPGSLLDNSTTSSAPTPVRDCFIDRDELKSAVDEYIDMDCGTDQSACELIVQKYGWPINFWCLGNVTDLSALFHEKESFNEDIGAWDVSRVTNMSNIFNYSSAFNRDLSSWDVSSVKSMYGMCKSCVIDCVFSGIFLS